jgi:hypothetical protein
MYANAQFTGHERRITARSMGLQPAKGCFRHGRINHRGDAMNSYQKYFSTCLLATAALLVGASPAWAQADFAVLANEAVTCTNGSIIGDVGTNQSPNDAPPGSVTLTTCPVSGTVHVGDGVAKQAFSDFLDTYDALEAVQCTLANTFASTSLGNHTFTPGVYCFNAAITENSVVWTLNGGATDTWLFKIGILGTGALTGNTFSVVSQSGAAPLACNNVTWWVAEAATMTDSQFVGTILAGAGITTTRGTFNGDAFAQADVTITGTAVTGCEGSSRGGKPKSKCNQGVGNGPEDCDPGNSNQGDESRSNDELGGIPGFPGRKGGNNN